MNDDEIRQALMAALRRVAPEADPGRLKPDVNLRDQLDLDSMDYLNFVISLEDAMHVAIPATEYARFATLDGGVACLQGLIPTERR
jgi:acyl carrier protein